MCRKERSQGKARERSEEGKGEVRGIKSQVRGKSEVAAG